MRAFDTVSPHQLNALSQPQNRTCVSLFMPTHAAGPDTRQNPIRLKNLLRETESRLLDQKLRKAVVSGMLGPARQLAQRSEFWRTQGKGLAIFLSEGFFQYFRLPLEFTERVLLSDRFEVTPLVPLFAAGGRYFLLVLSQKEARLFEGAPSGLAELDSPDLPHGVRDALKYDVHERQQQSHTGTGAPGRTKEGAVFHGQAPGVDDAKERLLEYFHQIDNALKDVLKDPRVPLVLAAVEELFPLYCQVNTYPLLLDEVVKGNWQTSTADELFEAAHSVLRPYFEKARREAVERFRSLVGTGKASDDIAEVLPAAFGGRVDYALIQPNTESWGRFYPDQERVEVHEHPQPGDEDLVNAVAVQTILHRGAVYTLPPPEMPVTWSAAAVFRYAM